MAATVSGGASAKPAGEIVRRDLTIDLPDFSDEQLQLDTLRGFNGYIGRLHEHRLGKDAAGLLGARPNPTAAFWRSDSVCLRVSTSWRMSNSLCVVLQ